MKDDFQEGRKFPILTRAFLVHGVCNRATEIDFLSVHIYIYICTWWSKRKSTLNLYWTHRLGLPYPIYIPILLICPL